MQTEGCSIEEDGRVAVIVEKDEMTLENINT